MENLTSNDALRLKSVIDTAIDGIITMGQKGIVEGINPAASKMFGYTPEEVIGKNIKMLMPEPTLSKHDQYLSNYRKTRKPTIIGTGREVIGLRKDKSTFPFRLAVSEVNLDDKVIYTGILHDLTEVKKAQEELLEANEELEKLVEERTEELEEVINELLLTNRKLEDAIEGQKEMNEMKSRFVSMASHEFRTPLSAILSSSSLINKYLREDQQENRTKHTRRIAVSVANLTAILDDFLSLAKLEEGGIKVTKSEIDILDLCRDIQEQTRGLIKRGQVIKHTHNLERTIVTDKKMVQIIMFNLISNAIKYSKDNGVIECDMSSSAGEFRLSIKDGGIGIPESDQKNLFSRFFRATNVETIQGTGIGLNIVKQYVDLLEGTIGFESKENVGTTFHVVIPISAE